MHLTTINGPTATGSRTVASANSSPTFPIQYVYLPRPRPRPRPRVTFPLVGFAITRAVTGASGFLRGRPGPRLTGAGSGGGVGGTDRSPSDDGAGERSDGSLSRPPSLKSSAVSLPLYTSSTSSGPLSQPLHFSSKSSSANTILSRSRSWRRSFLRWTFLILSCSFSRSPWVTLRPWAKNSLAIVLNLFVIR